MPIALLLATAPATAPELPATTESVIEPVAVAPTADAVPSVPAPAEAEQKADDLIIVTAEPGTIPSDPLQGANAFSYEAVQALDTALVAPAAMAYKSTVPSPVRSGIRNVLNNLQEPVIFLNFLLQLKPGRAAETLGRFAVNSTLGGAGLVDVAKRRGFNMPRRPNGFAYTLGYYGVKPGAYLFLPFIGPTSVRDVFGRTIDLFLLPAAIGKPFDSPVYSLTTNTLRALDDRVEADARLRQYREESGDAYEASRNAYHVKRQAEIDELRGKKGKSKPPAPK